MTIFYYCIRKYNFYSIKIKFRKYKKKKEEKNKKNVMKESEKIKRINRYSNKYWVIKIFLLKLHLNSRLYLSFCSFIQIYFKI